MNFEEITEEVTSLTNQIYEHVIVADKGQFANDLLHGVIVAQVTSGVETPQQDYRQFLGLNEARSVVENADLPEGGDSNDLVLLKKFLARMLKPNLTLNRDATEKKRTEAHEGVSPVMFQVKRGEVIVREGEKIREEQARNLMMIYQKRSGGEQLFMVLGVFALTLIILVFPYRFACKNIRKFDPSSQDILLLT